MKILKVTAGGQVSLPAAIRRRWGTDHVALVDEGDSVVLRPIPDDPIGAVIGIFKGRTSLTTDQMREEERIADVEAERQWRALH